MFGWTRRAAKDEQTLQLFCLQLLVLPGKEFQAGLQRRSPQNSLPEENVQHLFIETQLVVPAQHASSSTDSVEHTDTFGLLMCDTVAPRVLTTPLWLDSNLVVTLEEALMVHLTCLAHDFLCTHHWLASHYRKRGAQNLGSRPYSIQAQHDGFT